VDAFYRELDIPVRGGRARRFYFPHATAADAFRDRFGGERLTYTPEALAARLKTEIKAHLRAADCRRPHHDAGGFRTAAQVVGLLRLGADKDPEAAGGDATRWLLRGVRANA
jgi:hypothetical protein